MTHRLLSVRRSHPDLFTRGSYQRLEVRGVRATNVIAFARAFEGRCCITVAPRLVSSLDAASSAAWWGDTAIELPHELEAPRWHSQIVTGEVSSSGSAIALGALLQKLPVAVVLR
jgi:(1->4)-alpha-D-glucan 1-alpha-D-glucosylmutase